MLDPGPTLPQLLVESSSFVSTCRTGDLVYYVLVLCSSECVLCTSTSWSGLLFKVGHVFVGWSKVFFLLSSPIWSLQLQGEKPEGDAPTPSSFELHCTLQFRVGLYSAHFKVHCTIQLFNWSVPSNAPNIVQGTEKANRATFYVNVHTFSPAHNQNKLFMVSYIIRCNAAHIRGGRSSSLLKCIVCFSFWQAP